MQKWGEMMKDKEFIKSLIISFLFLSISLYINFISGTYATRNASYPVSDIILSNTRAFNTAGLFTFCPIVFFIFISVLSIYNPKRIPFVIKSVALFVVIRSIFICLTHLGPFPTEELIRDIELMDKFTFGGDLFFSGHVGIPYLFALMFWQNKTLRYFFIVYSIFMGVVVLLGHYHYTIDVLAAYFITYTIFHMSSSLFKKDKDLFLSCK